MLHSLIPGVDHPWLLLACLALSVMPLKEMWRLIFGDGADFIEDVKIAAVPDWYAWLKGRYWEGEWAELKLLFFALCGVGVPTALYRLGKVLLQLP